LVLALSSNWLVASYLGQAQISLENHPQLGHALLTTLEPLETFTVLLIPFPFRMLWPWCVVRLTHPAWSTGPNPQLPHS